MDFKGKSFEPNVDLERDKDTFKERPVVIMLPGLVNTSDYVQIRGFAEAIYKRDCDVVVINSRGLAGCPLTTPHLYSWNNTQDIREPVQEIYKKYVEPFGRKFLAIGCSLGAHRLACLLGEDGENSLFDAACCVQCPMKVWVATSNAKITAGGFYDRALAGPVADLYLLHEPVLKERFQEEFGIDIKETIKAMDPLTLNELDDKLASVSFGYKDAKEYHYKCACVHLIPNIKTTTLFMSSLDDPLVGEETIDFDVVRDNENCILATNKHGGHMGYYENAFSSQ